MHIDLNVYEQEVSGMNSRNHFPYLQVYLINELETSIMYRINSYLLSSFLTAFEMNQ